MPLQPRPIPAPIPDFLPIANCAVTVPPGARHARMAFTNVVLRRAADTAGLSFDGCTFDGCTFEIDGVAVTEAQWMAAAA